MKIEELLPKMSDSDSNNNNNNKNENRIVMSASSASDLHVNVKDVPFHIRKDMLAKRSSKVSSLLERNEMDKLRLTLLDLEADRETFELVARFCYGLEVKFSSDNIVSVLCVAYYLGMNEEQSSNNLLGKAVEFLEQRVLPCWNETVKALRSGDKSLDKLADIGLVDLFFDCLIEKATYDARLLGELIKNSEDESNDYRRNARRRLFDKDWKSEDLITIQLRFYEPLIIKAIKSRKIPDEYIALSVCKYAEKWVFKAEESQLGQRREVVEAVERLLPHERGLMSCEFLFESLKHSILLEASSQCQNGFEVRISKQLDMAKATSLKILTRGNREKGENFEDINLVHTVVASFYTNYAESTEDTSRFVKVAELMEEFLLLAASETSLKLETLVSIAGITVATSQGLMRYSDGIYKAIEAFLESHIFLTESEKMEVCKVLDCNKLSQEGCEQAAKNHRLPLRIIVQVLYASQLLIRDTVAKEIKVIEDKVDEKEEGEIVVSSDGDEMERMTQEFLGVEIEDHECVVHRWKDKKRSVWKQVKRKFGCMASASSSSTSVDACTCGFRKKRKKIRRHYKPY